MQEKTALILKEWTQPKYVLLALGMLILGAILLAAILRDKIVNPTRNQVSVPGQGRVYYKSDIAKVTLGVQIDKAPTSQEAISELNQRMAKILTSLEEIGIGRDKIETQNYSLNVQYDYSDGSQRAVGYDANQKLTVKVEDIQTDGEKIGQVISAASQAGANQMLGVNFEVSNMKELKQQARVLAIADAREKSEALADAAGVKLARVSGWYEEAALSPENPVAFGADGRALSEKALAPIPQVPSGTQEIVLEISLNYDLK